MIQQKTQTSASFSNGLRTISGVVVDVGNNLVGGIDQYFPAGTVDAEVPLNLVLSRLQALIIVSDKGCTIKTNGTDAADVQTISITGSPIGGTFPVYFGGHIATVPFDATEADLEMALEALPSIGPGGVACTGGPLPDTPITCTFAGPLAAGARPVFVVASGALTGGTSPQVAVDHTTPGLPTQTLTIAAGIQRAWSISGGLPCPITSDVGNIYVSNTYAQNLKIAGIAT